jgi:hypothetical protein
MQEMPIMADAGRRVDGVWLRDKTIKPPHRLRIRTNVLLRGSEKSLSMAEVLMLRQLFVLAKNADAGGSANLAAVPEEALKEVHTVYGGSGLFKLAFLAAAHDEDEFKHYMGPIAAGLHVQRSVSAEADLRCDNDTLRQSRALNGFNSNVIQPSLARKLYNPGRHHGYLVYGLGGPKILVSHPFQGVGRVVYDVYNNSADVVTSLMNRGYAGTFLFLDNLDGLNAEVKRVPAWLLWFSMIAAHSDLVLFIKEYEEDFGRSQRMEIDFTPDRVQKKVVEIPHEELTWAKKPEEVEGARILYGGNGRAMTEEEFRAEEAKHALPFVDLYANAEYPKDRIIRISEEMELSQYPLNYTFYEAG